jgi:hypothetical protein
MPIVTAFAVNGLFLAALIYYNEFKILENFIGSMNILSLFVGVYYAVTSAVSGGVVRAWAGISLVGLSIIDLGIPEPANSALHLAIAIIGALTPF